MFSNCYETKKSKMMLILSLYDSALKKGLYKIQVTHLNICSNQKLNKIDYKILHMDKELIAVLPSAYKQYCNRNNND